MKKARAILCGVLAALMLAGCGGSEIGKYAVAEAGTPARTRKTEGLTDTEALRQWTQQLWQQLYHDEQDSALWLGNGLFLNENMTFHKEPLDVLTEDYYASSYRLPMGTSRADKTIAAWLDQQTNDLLTGDTGAIKTKEIDLLRLYNTIYYKAAWRAEFSGGSTEKDIFTAADGTEQRTDFMHISLAGSPVARGEGYRRASLYLKDGGEMTFYLPDEGVTVEKLLQRKNILRELLAVNDEVVRVNWSVPKFDIHASLELNDALQALGVTDAFDKAAADFTPLTDTGAVVSSVMQAARVRIDEEGMEAAAYSEIIVEPTAAEPPPCSEEEMNLNRPFLFAIWKDGAPLFVGTVQTMEGM